MADDRTNTHKAVAYPEQTGDGHIAWTSGRMYQSYEPLYSCLPFHWYKVRIIFAGFGTMVKCPMYALAIQAGVKQSDGGEMMTRYNSM